MHFLLIFNFNALSLLETHKISVMTVERFFELQTKILTLESALSHFGMQNELKELCDIMLDTFLLINREEDLNGTEQKCLDFIDKYWYVKEKLDNDV